MHTLAWSLLPSVSSTLTSTLAWLLTYASDFIQAILTLLLSLTDAIASLVIVPVAAYLYTWFIATLGENNVASLMTMSGTITADISDLWTCVRFFLKVIVDPSIIERSTIGLLLLIAQMSTVRACLWMYSMVPLFGRGR